MPTAMVLAWARRAAWCAGVLLAGCTSLIPQTVALRNDWPDGVPPTAELAQLPFVPPHAYQGGPAALEMAMGHAGARVPAQALVEEGWLAWHRNGLQREMLAAPRRHGLVSYRIAPRYVDLLREVTSGQPVVVLLDLGTILTEWQYAVVNGFDRGTGTILLRSGLQSRQQMTFSGFERAWMAGGYWAMVVTPPERIVATATESEWLEALLGLARGGDLDAAVRGYRTALARWPDSLPAAVGLANQLHARGSLDESAAVLRTARQRHPQSVIVLNNLAQTLSDQGRDREALSLIESGNDPQSPFAGEVRATRQLIEQRLRGRGG
jgi:tetratricopeptide (TPR) repeat protein